MSKEKEGIVKILLDFLNSDSGLKEVPPEYVIHLPPSELNKSAASLLQGSELNSSQKEKFKMILLINEILLFIKNDEKDKIEKKLIEHCRDFIELTGLGGQLR